MRNHDLRGKHVRGYVRVSLVANQAARKRALAGGEAAAQPRRPDAREWAAKMRAQGTELDKSTCDQLDELCAFADAEGCIIVAVYGDPNMSASRFARAGNRPGFEQLRADMADGEVLWFWAVDRLVRWLTTYSPFRDACTAKRILWASRDAVYDLNDSRDRVNLNNMATQAENDAEIHSDRVRRGKASAAPQGRPPGRALFGYVRRYNPHTQEFEWDDADRATATGRPEDAPAEVVEQIFDHVAAGGSLYAIRDDLTRRGVPTRFGRARWDTSSIRQIAVNSRYARLKIPGGAQPMCDLLVTEETFRAVQVILGDAKRTKTRPHRPGGVLLSAVARCGPCGAGMSLSRGSTPTRRAHYTCRMSTCVSVLAGDLDQYADTVMRALLARDGAKADLTEQGDTAETVQARKDWDTARKKLAEAVEKLETEDISGEAYTIIQRREEGVIAKAQARLKASTPARRLLAKHINWACAAESWDALTVNVKRQIIAETADIRVWPASKEFGRFPIPVPDRVDWTWKVGAAAGKPPAVPAVEKIQGHAARARARNAEAVRLYQQFRDDDTPGSAAARASEQTGVPEGTIRTLTYRAANGSR